MSFWTDLNYVRPTRPPRITIAGLIGFAQAVGRLPLLADPRIHRVQIKRGRRIDQDHRGVSREIQIMPGLFQIEEIDWDIDLDDVSKVESALPSLLSDASTVYWASVGFAFGAVRDRVVRELGTPRPDNGAPNLLLADLSIHANVITSCGLGSDGPVPVGWFGVGIGGQGYLYPWSAADLIAKAVAVDELQALAALCRERFPVRPTDMSAWERMRRWQQARYVRRVRGDYHPFTGGPLDWSWSIAESG